MEFKTDIRTFSSNDFGTPFKAFCNAGIGFIAGEVIDTFSLFSSTTGVVSPSINCETARSIRLLQETNCLVFSTI